MKVLVVFGICLLIAFNTAAARDYRQKYCCGKSPGEVHESVKSGTCVSFTEFVHKSIQEQAAELDHSKFKSPTEARLHTWMHAFSDAALDCISNNRIYRNVHAALKEIHSLIEKFAPGFVQKKITEAQDYIEEHFDDLTAAKRHASPGLVGRIEDFVVDHTKQAVDVFQRVRKSAQSTWDSLLHGPMHHIFDELVKSVHDCLETDPNYHEETFKCRDKVRSIAYDFIHAVHDHLSEGKSKVKVPPHHTIESYILKFTSGVKELESMIKGETSLEGVLGFVGML